MSDADKAILQYPGGTAEFPILTSVDGASSIDVSTLTKQTGLTALDYTQSRGFMPFMANQTPLYEEEAALLRELGATVLMAKAPDWPVLGPPQGLWVDIWPLGEPVLHEPVYTHERTGD